MAIRTCVRVCALLSPVTVALMACAGPQRAPGELPSATGSDAAAASSAAGESSCAPVWRAGDGPAAANGQTPGPPTAETCAALPVPEGRACHWMLVPTHYCGGPAPTEKMLWPHCSCEPCTQDAHCPAGGRCTVLPTDEECGVTTHVCVSAASGCGDHRPCGPNESCMWIAGKATCKVPTMYPPRP